MYVDRYVNSDHIINKLVHVTQGNKQQTTFHNVTIINCVCWHAL